MAKVIDDTNVGRLVSDIKAKSDASYWPIDQTTEVDLATVATTGSYNDLLDKPTAATGAIIYVGTCPTAAGTATKVVTTATSFPLQNGLPVVGTVIGVKYSNTNSASAPKLNVNGTGAQSIYYNTAVVSSTSAVYGGTASKYTYYVWDGTNWCWLSQGNDANDNTIGYTIRTNYSQKPVSGACYRYRLLFTSADGTKWVPANTGSSTNATATRTVNQTPIDPFGPIAYYGTTTALSSGGNPSVSYQYQQSQLTLGYSFNRTGAALTLTSKAPLYIKCAPQTDGSAIMDSSTPYVQALPSTEDGKIYIFLGIATSATQIELNISHPVYYYKDGAIRLWTNPQEIQNTPIKYDVGNFDTADWSVLENVNLGDLIMSHGGGMPEAWTVSYIEVDGSDISVEITALQGDAIYYCWVLKESGVWAFDSSSYKRILCESVGNKIIEITSSATHVQYPSAKAVWDAVSTKYTKPSGGIPASDLADGVIPTVPTDVVKYSAQTLSDSEKTQARTNIGAGTYTKPSGGIPSQDLSSGVSERLMNIVTSSKSQIPNNFTTSDITEVFDEFGIDMGDFMALSLGTSNFIRFEGSSTPSNTWLYSVSTHNNEMVFSYGVEQYVLTISSNPGLYTFTKHETELTSNKVTALSAQSTDTQYPSAKCVYDSLAEKQDTIDASHKLDYGLLSNTPTIPAAQVNSDWNASSGVAQILNKPTLQQVYNGNVPDPSTWLNVVNPGDIVYYDMGSFYIVTHIQRGSGAGDTNYQVELGGVDVSGSGIDVGGAVATKSNNTWSFAFKSSNVDTILLTTQPAGGMLPNVMYNLGTLTGTVTFSLASPTYNTIVNHYYWTFTAGSTAPTITWPSGISWFGGSAPVITAGKHYDVSILDNIAVCMEV